METDDFQSCWVKEQGLLSGRVGKSRNIDCHGSWRLGHMRMVGTLDPSFLQTPKSFGLGPLMAEIWAFFQILGDFQLFYFEAINSHGAWIFHRNNVKITYKNLLVLWSADQKKSKQLSYLVFFKTFLLFENFKSRGSFERENFCGILTLYFLPFLGWSSRHR